MIELNRKKLFSFFFLALSLSVLFSGCGNSSRQTLKTGLGVSTVQERSDADGDLDGKIDTTVTICALTLDQNNKIVSVSWDQAESGARFSSTGAVTSVTTGELRSKKELGTDYGMKGASPIGKEWNEQVAALESYAVGRDIHEVLGMPLTAGNTADITVLKTTCTIKVTPLLEALSKAASNAR